MSSFPETYNDPKIVTKALCASPSRGLFFFFLNFERAKNFNSTVFFTLRIAHVRYIKILT